MSDAPSKSCGSCGMCCKVLHISELQKPAGEWCGVYRKGSGCGDYERLWTTTSLRGMASGTLTVKVLEARRWG